MSRLVRLTERRSSVRRLDRADVAALVADWGQVVEVTPTHRRGRYRLTPRGWVGGFRTPGCVWQVSPKLGWDCVHTLLGAARRPADPAGGAGREVRSALARRLARLMHERAAAGLVSGFSERASESPTVRGRIDLPALVNRPAGGPTLPVRTDEFTTDQSWNGWPVAVAGRLAQGELDPEARADLAAARAAFGNVRPCPVADPDRWATDPRLLDYRPLFDWCRLVCDALSDAAPLFNLETLFEAHLGDLLAGNQLAVQRPVGLTGNGGGLTLRPDYTVGGAGGRLRSVWDAKWKVLPATGPHPADVHQVLAYAAVLGVRTCGLVFPGRRFRVRWLRSPGGVSVGVVTCRLVGTPEQLAHSTVRLRRVVLAAT